MSRQEFARVGVVSIVLSALFMFHAEAASYQKRLRKSPYSSSEIRAVETDQDRQLRELRKQEINQIRITLGRRIPVKRQADLYFRLAEIYFESYRSEYLIEGKAHERRIAEGQKNITIDHSRSHPYLNLGIKACRELLKLKIPYERMDQVLYFLAFNYGELEQRKESLKYYKELISRYPQSSLSAEAYKELAEEAFDSRKFTQAQGLYEKAIRVASPEMRPRLLHRLAWTYYRTKNYSRAVSIMKQSVAAAIESGEKLVSLKEEALRDMAIFMTESGRVEDALSYFNEVAGDKNFYPKMLERLAAEYERAVQPKRATQVYEALLKAHPESESAFRVLVKLVDLDLRHQKFGSALKRLKDIEVPQGGESSSEDETQVAAKNLKAMVRRTATENHDLYRKKNKKEALVVAENYYTLYLNVFLKNESPKKETPEIQMYLAEVKRELGKSKEASSLYRLVVDSKDKRYAKQAGELWTASLSEAIKNAAKNQGVTRSTEKPSALELEFVDAADRLTEALGETTEARESSLRAAQVLAGYKDTKSDSVDRIEKIIKRWPNTAQAVTAARLWLQIQKDSGDSKEAKEVIDELQKNSTLLAADKKYGKSELALELESARSQLRIQSISKAEKDKDFKEAARGYETYGNDSKDEKIAEKSYLSAIDNYFKADDYESVNRVSQTWMKRFPKNSKVLDSYRSTATLFLVEGKFDQAAKLFAEIGKTHSDEDALLTAVRIYEGIHQDSQARELRSYHLSHFSKSSKRWDNVLALALNLMGSDHESEAAKLYRSCLSQNIEEASECGTRLADLHLKNKNLSEAKSLYQKVASFSKQRRLAASKSPYVAYAYYQLADLIESHAHFETLRLPEAQLKKALTQRINFLEPLSRAYLAAVEAGGPWGVAALHRLASWAMKFANEVDAITPPQGANAQVAQAFKKNLESVSLPLRKKAIGTWLDSYSKAERSEIFSPLLPEIGDRLADAGVTYPKRAQGTAERFKLAGVSPDSPIESIRKRLRVNLKDVHAWLDYGNRLWNDNYPILAQMAYERALAINPKYAYALNNIGVVRISLHEEDWTRSEEVGHTFKQAVRYDEFFTTAKFNLAQLYNYYRLFKHAKPLWEQVIFKITDDSKSIALDGLATALAGQGQWSQAEEKLKLAGGSSDRFARAYHEAAYEKSAKDCLSRVNDLSFSDLKGFEKDSAQRLKEFCSK